MFESNDFSKNTYDEYILEDKEKSTRAVIVPDRGGILSSFSIGSEEFIYFDYENFYSNERPRCGMPILFPCCGRTDEDKYIVLGEEFPMPIHGIAHTSTWNVKEFKEGSKSITIELSANEETRRFYPFKFNLQYTYELKGNKLFINQTYRNEDKVPMPFGFGFHPYFNISSIDNLEIDIKSQGSLNFSTGQIEPYENPIKIPVIPEYNGVFISPEDEIVFLDKKSGHRIEIEFDKHYSIIMIWSLTDRKFLCIEPWNDVPNALNTGVKNILNPGEELKSTLSISIEKV